MDRSIKILVVDDYSTMRKIIIGLLKDFGFSTIKDADDGKTALSLLKEHPFDLVISDWDMPGMTGIELLKAIRADEKLSKLPVLLVTAETKKEHIIEAVKSGVNGYIVKPFTSETLKTKLEKILSVK